MAAAAANGHNCTSFVPPRSLKDLLDFFAKLQNGQTSNGVKKSVLEELKNRLTGDGKGWIRNGNNGADWFYNNANSSNGTGCVMPKSIAGLKELRNSIDKSSNPYHLPESGKDNPAASDPCVKKYADAILGNAFPLFGCLFYLWFRCSTSGTWIGSGAWDWESVNGDSESGSNGLGNRLKNFLTDTSGKENKFLMLPRGYNGDNGELKGSTEGKNLFKDGSAHTLFGLNNPGGHFQQALFFLLFLAPTWCHSMSGHALFFLYEMIKSDGSLMDANFLHVSALKLQCSSLETQIKNFSNGGQGGISPVYIDSTNGNTFYKDKLNPAHIMQYVSWLWWCIPQLAESLREMSADSKNWNNNGGTDNFKNSSSFGPFPWGFTFTTDWKNGNGASQLNGKLDKLISAIEHFRDYHIGAFFWAIRRPFAYGSLAAWILSFTFLLYVNLLPLDLFHLKSHLLASSSFYRSDVIHSTLISNVTDVSYFKIF